MSDPSRDSRKGNEHDGSSSTSRSNTNNNDDDNNNDPHRLTSLLPSTGRGGLMKPPSSAASASAATTSASGTSGGSGGSGTQSQSQQPRASLLGLDRLAASKRKDNAESGAASASADGTTSSKPKAAQAQGRQYRRSNETPVVPSQQHQQHPVDVRRNQRRDHPYQPASERRRTGGHGSTSYNKGGGGGDDHRRGGNGNDYDHHDNYDSHDRRDNRRSRPGESSAPGGGSSYHQQPGGRQEGQHDPSGSNNSSSSRDPNRSSRRDDPDDSYRRPRDYSQQSSNRHDDPHNNNNNNDSYRDGPGRRRGSEINTDNRRQPQVTPSTTASRNDSSQFRSYRQQDRDGGDGNSGRGRRLEDAPTPGRQSSYQQQQQQRTPSSQRRGSNHNAWEVETPAPLPRDNVDAALIEPLEHADEDFDRDFYLQEDEGHAIQDTTNDNDLGRFLYTNAKIEARQEAMEKQQKEGQKNPRQNARQSALNHDQQAWEENRLLSAGAAVQGTVDLDHVTEQDTSVTLLVHQVKPPFLDGRVSFSTIREAVPTVRDASSDFAKMAREGSVTLRTLRANKDKNAMRQKFWELGGTHMGNVMGIKEGDAAGDSTGDKSGKDDNTDDDRPAEETADGEIDYKKSTGFKDHVKNKEGDGPVSEFAKSKTIRQQREFLPAFSVREELLNIIRENNVVIVVGATGSGAYIGAGGVME